MSGFDVCRAIKSDNNTKDVGVIMVTAKGEESDIVAGLELGADDYVVKPFSPSVLLARVRSILRRKDLAPPVHSETVEIKDLKIDSERHEVFLNNKMLDLTATEFKLLYFLASNQGKVYTRDQIIHAVHGTDYPVTRRSVDVQVTGLRKKLLEYESYIETIRGVGYRFSE